MHGWLSAPDVSVNFNAARRKHQPETGAWFIGGAQFSQWKDSPERVLCLYGARELLPPRLSCSLRLTNHLAAGCGKTILW